MSPTVSPEKPEEAEEKTPFPNEKQLQMLAEEVVRLIKKDRRIEQERTGRKGGTHEPG